MTETVSRYFVAVARIVGALVVVVVGVVFVIVVAMVVRSRFGSSGDPHGYVLIFGTMFAVPLGLVVAVVAPLILPRSRRAIGYAVSLPVCGVIIVGLVAMLLTA